MKFACWTLHLLWGMNTNQYSLCFSSTTTGVYAKLLIFVVTNWKRPKDYSACSKALWSRRGGQLRCIPFRREGWWNVHWGWWCPAPAGVSSGGWRRSSAPSPPLALNPQRQAASRKAACGVDQWDHTEPAALGRKWWIQSYNPSQPPTEIQLACVFDFVPPLHPCPPPTNQNPLSENK